MDSSIPYVLYTVRQVNQAILQHCFFWFGNTGADASIAILLLILKRFSCNGAMDWRTMCFCCESVLQNGDSFVIARREFQRKFRIHRSRTVPSAHAIKTRFRNFKATGSTLKKKRGSVKTVRTPENIVVVKVAI
jgi:membrane-bound lytic murein transglycosylase